MQFREIYTKIMTNVSLSSFLIKSPVGDEETLKELIDPTPPQYKSN